MDQDFAVQWVFHLKDASPVHEVGAGADLSDVLGGAGRKPSVDPDLVQFPGGELGRPLVDLFVDLLLGGPEDADAVFGKGVFQDIAVFGADGVADGPPKPPDAGDNDVAVVLGSVQAVGTQGHVPVTVRSADLLG